MFSNLIWWCNPLRSVSGIQLQQFATILSTQVQNEYLREYVLFKPFTLHSLNSDLHCHVTILPHLIFTTLLVSLFCYNWQLELFKSMCIYWFVASVNFCEKMSFHLYQQNNFARANYSLMCVPSHECEQRFSRNSCLVS